ncbi:MAG: tetratricopeptide repeat protein [Desulfovibrionaceae bacterium]|nr:tetratricopeptide repeat protein [Desulfovibrionaceae bacterium]
MCVGLLASCVGSKADAQEQTPTQTISLVAVNEALKDEPEIADDDEALLANTDDMTPEAKSVYAFLLLDQAFHNDDEDALFEAVPILKELKASNGVWLEAGLWLFNHKSERTQEFVKQARELWPEDSSLLMLNAEVMKDENIDAAINLIRNYLKTHPEESNAKLGLAALILQKDKYNEAYQILETIKDNDRKPYVDLHTAKALIGMKRYDNAVSCLKRAIKNKPDLIEAYIELGELYENLGQINNAIKTYENLLKANFINKNVFLRLIRLSLEINEPERALRYFEAAPDDIPFTLACAEMFLNTKHYLQAETILKPLIERNDAPIDIYLLLAEISWEHLRNLDVALSYIDKMPASYQQSSNTILLRVHLLAKADRKDEALAVVRQGKKIFSDETKFWDLEARILMAQDKLTEAINVLREATAKWPDDMNMLLLMGNILDEAGDKKAALKLMEQIIDREPNNFQALNYVGYSLADANRDLDRAITLLERAIKLAPDRPYIIDSLAWAYYRSGRKTDALREIRRAVKLPSSIDPTIWEHYGDIAKSLSLTQEAREAYAKALELKPDNAEVLRKKISQL